MSEWNPLGLQARINRAAERCLSQPRHLWPAGLTVERHRSVSPQNAEHVALLEHYAREMCGDSWEWRIVESIGAPPMCVLTGQRTPAPYVP